MKYQRKNGSLFNSPATTAAVYNHLKNADCLNYLQSVLEKFGNAGMFSDLPWSELIFNYYFLCELMGFLGLTFSSNRLSSGCICPSLYD